MDAHSVELLIGRRGGFGSFDLSDFEVEATVTRVLHGSPDTAEIIVKNLDEPTAGSLTAGAYVELQANGVRLFGGDVSDVEARWAGGTVDYRITAADGRDTWETAAVAVAKPAGTTLDEVIRALAAQASIPVAYVSADVGAVVLAENEIEEAIAELRRKGELSEEEGKKALGEWRSRRRVPPRSVSGSTRIHIAADRPWPARQCV